MKFINKDNIFHYLFLLTIVFSVLYRLSYNVLPLFYLLSSILIVFLSLLLNIFIKKILNQEDLKKLKDNKNSCIQLGFCYTFLALYPVLHFYTVNYASLEAYYLFVGIATVLLGILSFTFIYFIILRNFWTSFYMSSFLGVFFYLVNLNNIDNLGIFLLIALIIYISYFLFKKGFLTPTKNIITICAIVLLIFTCFDFVPVISRIWGGICHNFKIQNSFVQNRVQDKEPVNFSNQRDIYIILLDMYPGEKSLEKLFKYDNSNFGDELQKRGFYVFRNLYANYNLTAMALPTMLNMDYIEDTDFKDRYSAIDNARMFKLAQKSGRKTIYINHSPFFRYVNPNNTELIDITDSEYEYALSKTYNDSIVYAQYQMFTKNKKECLKPFNILRRIATEDENNKLIFAHFEMPHYPYLFDENGKSQTDSSVLRDEIRDSKLIVREKNFISYLKFTNNEVLNFIDYVFQNSDKKPIILISGDHGIRTNDYVKNWESHINETLVDKISMYSRFVTFAAYYNPDDDKKEIEKSNSIVNLYRLFANTVFDTKFDIIQDKHTMFFCALGCENYRLFKNSHTFTNEEFKKRFE